MMSKLVSDLFDIAEFAHHGPENLFISVVKIIGSFIFLFLNKLNSREKLIVSMRFGLDNPDGKEKTQKEVADLLGISQSYISRLEKKIMQRLKREMVRYE